MAEIYGKAGQVLLLICACLVLYWLGFIHGRSVGSSTELASVSDAAHRQELVAVRQDEEQKSNLKEVSHELQDKLRAAGAVAVRNYDDHFGLRNDAGSCSVPATTSGIPGHDGSGQEWVAEQAVSPQFIKDCAADAAELDAWHLWAELNRIPVENE